MKKYPKYPKVVESSSVEKSLIKNMICSFDFLTRKEKHKVMAHITRQYMRSRSIKQYPQTAQDVDENLASFIYTPDYFMFAFTEYGLIFNANRFRMHKVPEEMISLLKNRRNLGFKDEAEFLRKVKEIAKKHKIEISSSSLPFL